MAQMRFPPLISEFAPKNLAVAGPLGLILGGLFLSWLTKTEISFAFPGFLPILWATLFGLFLSVVALLSARAFAPLGRFLDWVFEISFRGEYSWILIFLIRPGLTSLGEEIFFRGFLQPHLGLWMTSLAFALFHFRTSSKALLLMPFAFFLGLIFGQSYLLTGSIFVSMLIHFVLMSSLGIIYRLVLQPQPSRP